MLNHNFSVIGLCETWLNVKSQINSLNIPGYTLLTGNRDDRVGGGFALYISNNLQYISRPDLNDTGDNPFECFFVVEFITPHNKKNIITGVVYKAPDADFNIFITCSKNLLQRIVDENIV